MSKKKSLPIFTILFLIFLILKLAEIGQVATWSWWWVTAPLWMPLIAGLFIAGGVVIVAVIVAYIDSKF
jgi:hypothetical protein